MSKITVNEALEQLDGWEAFAGREAICKTYQFRNFVDAFAWMTRIADVAEAMNHHPEWSNVYNRVTVMLTTHDAGGVTDLDVKLAQTMDASAP